MLVEIPPEHRRQTVYAGVILLIILAAVVLI
jgi:hypothetical protein